MRVVIFLAHPIRLNDAQIEAEKGRVTTAVRAAARANGHPEAEIIVVPGRDDFQARMIECGGWDGWATDVARGRAYRDGVMVPRYDGIVVAPGDRVGKGTARIIAEALPAGRPVFILTESDALARVTNIVQFDPSDAQTGWILET